MPTPSDSSIEAASAAIPTAASLNIKSQPAPSHLDQPAPLPDNAPATTQLKRDEWMLSHPQASAGTSGHSEPSTEERHPNADLRGEGVRAETAKEDGSGRDSEVPDFFSSLGKERSRPPRKVEADKQKAAHGDLQISSRELNTQLIEGKDLDEYAEQPKKETVFGAPGYQWRMMKLRKTYEQAQEEGRSVEEVVEERYGDMDAFNEARAERQYLDDRDSKRKGQPSSAGKPSNAATPQNAAAATSRSFMFTEQPSSPFAGGSGGMPPRSAAVSRNSFRKPGETPLQSAASTPQASVGGMQKPGAATTSAGPSRVPSFAGSTAVTPNVSKPSTPVPSVFTPTSAPQPSKAAPQPPKATDDKPEEASSDAVQSAVRASQSRDAVSNPPMDAAGLNRLEAKVMKAEMMGKENAASLREKLEREKQRANSGGDRGGGYFPPTTSAEGNGDEGVQGGTTAAGAAESNIQVLPTLDGQGRLYDVGTSRPGQDEDTALKPGNRGYRNQRIKADRVETHDPKTGERVRYGADDDSVSLAELVRQEKFKGGSSDQKNYDAEFASRIATDGHYRDDLNYLDDNSDKLARQKMRSDALKRQFAVNDFAKTKKALETCRFCWRGDLGGGDEERPPLARIVASGTRAYLALTETEPLVDGHVLIVPIQHHLCILEADDDTWDEVRNFMKCLLQLAAADSKRYVFYETVLSLRQQRHTVIECVPVPMDLFDTLPGLFHQELQQVEGEWSQHSKAIAFSPQRPLRRSLVAQLPYFAVLFDHKGEKGYGHVIEGQDSGSGLVDRTEEQDPYGIGEISSRGTNAKFEHWFAPEIIGNVLDMEDSRRWRKPRRVDGKRGEEMLARFKSRWEPYDWTKMLRSGEGK